MTATLYTRLVRLAHEVPTTRGDLVPLLRRARQFNTDKALQDYLKDHPGADPDKHWVEDSRDDEDEAPAEEKPKRKWLPTKETFKKVTKAVKDLVVGEIVGEYKYWKDAAVAIKNLVVKKDMTPEEKRATARVAVTESLALVRNAILKKAIGSFGGPILFLGVKTAVAAAQSKAVQKVLKKLIPDKAKGKKAADMTPEAIGKLLAEEFAKALDEALEEYNPERKA